MKVSELINNAWYLSEIVARDLQTVSGSQSADGLRYLNSLLTEHSITGRYIPYFSHTTMPCVIGQEEYAVPNLIELSTLTFNLDTVRYELNELPRTRYFGSARADTITALPNIYFVEKNLGGSTIYIYPLPADAYTLNINGKYSLGTVALNDELSTTLDDFYVTYLEYALAQRLCELYNFPYSEAKTRTLEGFLKQLNNITQIDLTVNKASILSGRGSVNYGQVNLGKGWTTP